MVTLPAVVGLIVLVVAAAGLVRIGATGESDSGELGKLLLATAVLFILVVVIAFLLFPALDLLSQGI